MELSNNQYTMLSSLLPVQRGNVKINNRQLLNTLLYIAENGYKWRRLPKEYGNWHTTYIRLRRWADKGVLERIFTALQEQRLIAIRVECIGLASTSIKVHPDAAGALKKRPRVLPDNLAMAMDKAYKGDETRVSAALAGFIPVVPPKINRRKP